MCGGGGVGEVCGGGGSVCVCSRGPTNPGV